MRPSGDAAEENEEISEPFNEHPAARTKMDRGAQFWAHGSTSGRSLQPKGGAVGPGRSRETIERVGAM